MGLENDPSTQRQPNEQLQNSRGSGYRLRELAKQVVAHVDTLALEPLRQLLLLPDALTAVRVTRAINQMCAALKRHVDEVTGAKNRDALEATWELATVLLRAFPEEPRLGFSAGRLVEKMQSVDPLKAAAMTLEGLKFGWAPRSRMNIFTLSKAQAAAGSYDDLRLVTDLWVSLLSSRGIDPEDLASAQRLNVYLACTTDPKPAHERIGSLYPEEETIADVARRTVLGVQVADAAMRAGVRFTSETTEGRINCSLRGIASVSAALGLECARAEGRITNAQVENVRNELSLAFAWTPPDFESHELGDLRDLSERLLMGCLQVACQCLNARECENEKLQPDIRYRLEGRTVSNILLALEKIALLPDESRCVEVAKLLSRSLQIPSVSREVSRKAIHVALEWMNQDGIDPVIQGHAIWTALSGTLPKIADVELLGRLSERLLEYLARDPEAEEAVLSCLEAMGERSDELLEEAERKRRAAGSEQKRENKPTDTSSRRGGNSSTWFSDLLGDALKRRDDD
jgi:hypothetical protein